MDGLGLGIDDEYDLDEIESRLYSQVYHGNADAELESNVCNGNIDTAAPVLGRKQSYRYFGRIQTGAIPTDHTSTSNYNETPGKSFGNRDQTIFSPPSVDFNIFSNGCQNIINQFTIPVIINTDGSNSWNGGNLNDFNFQNYKANVENVASCTFDTDILSKKQKNHIRNRKRKQRQKLKHLNKNSQEINKKIIFISDESEDECILIKEDSIMSSNIMNEKVEKECDNLDDNDDIIYIPPPPVQIINVDDEEAERIPEISTIQVNDKFQVEQTSKISATTKLIPPHERQEIPQILESASNDFLDNAINENAMSKFNFALHGSDFSNTSEFVRHNSNIDCYETESSCSTNDHNKDFNNSAKSIVFDEVEFPKEDIFSDKNLDTFSSFITPNRNNKSLENSLKISLAENENVGLIESDSSTSSTESDYEPIDIKSRTNKNLPMLSPMLTPQELSKINSTPKLNKKTPKDTGESSTPIRKSLSKRKSDGDCWQTQSNNELCKKLKRNIRKPENAENSVNESGILKETEHSEKEDTICDIRTKKKKKRKSQISEEKSNRDQVVCNDFVDSDPNASIDGESIGEHYQLKKKKRKKKKSNKSVNIVEEQLENSYCESEATLCDSELTLSTKTVEEETLERPEKDTGCANHTDNIKEIVDEQSYDSLNDIVDPSDINFFNQPIESADDQQSQENDDIIIINENESRASDHIILVDDKSDSEVELIENIDCVDLTNLELANCITSAASTSDDIFKLNLNEESLDDLNDFDVKFIQSKQSDDPLKWLISHKDRSTYLVLGKKGPRCNRCRHFGHIGSKCPDKPNPPCCSLCSDTNHQEPRCPNKVCRQCGNPGEYSTSYCYLCFKYRHVKCNLCNVPGHISKSCPDQWRRYHLTTEAGPIIVPNQQVMRPRNQQWCSGCAQQGHLEHECNDTYYHREFPPTRPDIVVYSDILNENSNQSNVPNIPQIVPPSPTIPNDFPLYRIPSLLNNLVTINSGQLLPFGRTITPNTLNSNIIIQVPNLVPNPYVQQNILSSALIQTMRSNFQHPNINPLSASIIEQMRNNFQNPSAEDIVPTSGDPSKFDMRKIQELFMSMPHATVKSFVRKQVEELDTKIMNYNPKLLRHKLFKYDRIHENMSEKTKKDRCFWFRVLNMFIFGIHNLNDGKLHIRFIRNFLASKKSQEFDESRRRSLFNSYSYIFGVDKHTNVSYYRLIKLLVDRCNEGKVVKPL